MSALAVLVDPATGVVVWANEAVYAYIAERGGSPDLVSDVDQAIPTATTTGLREIIGEVALTGEPAHRTTNIVSTARGSATLVLSVYRVPGGHILVLAENSWSAERRSPRLEDRVRRPRRR